MKTWRQNTIQRITTTDFIPRKNIDVVKRLMLHFKDHIGEDNKISINSLFRKIYKAKTDDVSDLQRYLLLTQISTAISFMRQKSNCFIIRNGSFLWVAKTQSDYDIFRRNIQAHIKGLMAVEDRCAVAVKERWFTQEFRVTKQLKAPEDNLMLL